MVLWHHGHREPLEQGCCRRYVLARVGEMREAPVILYDPLVHLAGPGACASAVYSSCDRLLELYMFLLKLEPHLLELLVPRTQLLLLRV